MTSFKCHTHKATNTPRLCGQLSFDRGRRLMTDYDVTTRCIAKTVNDKTAV